MGRNEIKLREKQVTADTLKRYRNYSALLKKVERNKRYKETLRIFIISLIVTFVVLLLIVLSYVIVKWEREREQKNSLDQKAIVHVAKYGHKFI